MIADFFTKPLQGNLFRTFRDVILGYKHTSTLMKAPVSSAEERVEIHRPNERGYRHDGTGTNTKIVQTEQMVEEVKKSKEEDITKVTWADVVKRSTASKAPQVENKRFVSRSFSRNNPVNRTGV